MNEKMIDELLGYVLHNPDSTTIQARIEEYYQAVEWAEQQQRWDLVIKLVDALSSHFIHSRSKDLDIGRGTAEQTLPTVKNFWEVEGQDKDEVSVVMRNFWEQGRELITCGLSAAKRTGQNETRFLTCLSRLSAYLNDFQTALDYLKQQLDLVRPDLKWHLARSIHHLGQQAQSLGDFLAARACYLESLGIAQELDNKYAIADVLDFMAANEQTRIEKWIEAGKQFDDELKDVIDSLWQLSKEFRKEAELDQEKLTDRETSSFIDKSKGVVVLYERLNDTLTKLNTLS